MKDTSISTQNSAEKNNSVPYDSGHLNLALQDAIRASDFYFKLKSSSFQLGTMIRKKHWHRIILRGTIKMIGVQIYFVGFVG